ncbi:hypothetical protein [Gluconobacter morbifer]|uniref:Uncharacterized protein n=1 Tax=Gluconobacter morbifer G707 TaxID=1088869 RepID=G6XGX1_9PROT|nr:hypothetical protein [Gluconobacter morbifer]EHH69429.1 hypothetical protein GMO_07360 [Gluconobacter morbifer G707]
MMRILLACCASGLLLAGCSSAGGSHGPKPDQSYDDAMDTARSVYDSGQITQAEAQYRSAYDRALLRDDVDQIHEAGFNLATVLLNENQPRRALIILGKVESAMMARHRADLGDLRVVEAAALYRLGDISGAQQKVQGEVQSADTGIRERALYLTGLCASDLRQGDVLSQAVTQLGLSPEKGARTDRDELLARLDLLRGHPVEALGLAETVVDRRRDRLDYRGMRRALLLAAQSADAAGQSQQAARLRQQEDDSLRQSDQQRSVRGEVSDAPDTTGHDDRVNVSVSLRNPGSPIRINSVSAGQVGDTGGTQ